MTLQAQRILFFFLLSLFTVYVILCFLAFPVADDFTVPLLLKNGKQTFPELLSFFRNSWNGRYTSHVFSMILPYEFFGIGGYHFALITTLLAFFWSTYLFLRSIFNTGFKQITILLFTAWFMLLYMHILPGPEETIYWWSGALGYTWAIIFHEIWYIVFLKWNETKHHKWTNTLFISIISIIVCGFTEISLVLTLIFIIIFSISSFRLKKFDIHFFIILTSAVSAAIVVLTAPGNSIRMTFFPESQSFMTAIMVSIESLAKLNGIAIQRMSVILTVILIFPFIHEQHINNQIKKLVRIHPLLFLLIWQTVLFFSFFVQSWAMGINPPMRIYNFILFFWLTGFLMLVFNIKLYLTGKKRTSFRPLKGKILYAMTLIVIMSMFLDFIKPPGKPVIFGGNMPAAVYDLTYNFHPFRDELLHRNNEIQIQIQSGADTLILQPLKYKPKVVFYLDISKDPHHFINAFMANSLGVQSVRLSADNKTPVHHFRQ